MITPYYSVRHDENQTEILTRCPAKRQWQGKFIPCCRQRCPSSVCRKAWARKQATIRQRSFRDSPPTHTLVIRPPSYSDWCKRKSKFTDRLKYQFRRKRRLQFEYEAQAEPDRAGSIHIHLDIITSPEMKASEVKSIVKDALEKTFNEAMPVYCGEVRNPQGLARYNPKDMKSRSPMPVPEQLPRRTRLTSCSRRFYVKPKATLWNEAKQEWYPPADTTNKDKSQRKLRILTLLRMPRLLRILPVLTVRNRKRTLPPAWDNYYYYINDALSVQLVHMTKRGWHDTS